MNVYDFDGTIYKGDSSIDFYKHCLRRSPRLLLLTPLQLLRVLAALPSRDKTTIKQALFIYLPRVPDVYGEVGRFWQTRGSMIHTWYLTQKQPDDVIISASPRFLLAPICMKLGVTLIASEVDPTTGRFMSRNCSGQNKPKRFREVFKDATVDCFYSDSRNDLPMARMARKAYMVKRGRVREWKF